MAKERLPQIAGEYRPLSFRRQPNTGRTVIGHTSVSIPIEDWAFLGSPLWALLLINQQDLHVFSATEDDLRNRWFKEAPRCRRISFRQGRQRCYIHLLRQEVLGLIPGAYRTARAFDTNRDARTLQIPNAVR